MTIIGIGAVTNDSRVLLDSKGVEPALISKQQSLVNVEP